MLDTLKSICERYDHYTELRYHDRIQNRIRVRTGILEEARSNRITGVGARVLIGGAWGFSSTSNTDKEAIIDAVEKAKRAAKARVVEEKVDIAPTPLATGRFESSPTEDSLVDHSLEEKLSLCIGANKMMDGVIGTTIYYEYIDHKYIATNDGAFCEIVDMKPTFMTIAVASEGAESVEVYGGKGVTGGWKALFSERSAADIASESRDKALTLLHAKRVGGGRATVIIAPDVTGILAHEAIGHTVEADLVLSGSIVSGKIGQKVANDCVTLVDSGQSPIKENAEGVVLVDDEGVPTKKTVIIDNGILRSYLHNRETAARFGVEPTGNARAFEYSDEPIIRMRNTYIEPVDWNFEEMVEDMREGYLIKNPLNGEASLSADFMFGIAEAYPIHNGELGDVEKLAAISGNAFDVLRSTDAISRDFEYCKPGHCGKGQPAKVGLGGPYIRCKAIIGGV